MTVIRFEQRVSTRRIARENAEYRLEEIKADHALVAVAPPLSAQAEAPLYRRATAFIAQLAATRDQAPQTRALRRAEPAEAISVYQAAMKTAAPAAGQVSRDL